MSYLMSSLADIDDYVNHTCVDTDNSFLCKCVVGFGGNHRPKKELLWSFTLTFLINLFIYLISFLTFLLFRLFVSLFVSLSHFCSRKGY